MCYISTSSQLLTVYDIISVPDPVDELSAVAFGTTCIEVSWSCPINLHGPPDDRRYFLTYSGGSHSFTNDVGASRSATLEDVMPGVNYTIEVYRI